MAKKLSNTSKPGTIVILPEAGPAPKGAVPTICDGCGAEVWVVDRPEKSKVFCLDCLRARKVI